MRAEFEAILRFWLDRGVDGFRVDVAHGLVKAAGPARLRRRSWTCSTGQLTEGAPQPPMWDQDGVHEIYRQWRAVLDAYGQPDRILFAEAWVRAAGAAARYVRPDEMHQAFNFDFLETPVAADDLREVIDDSLEAADSVGAPTTWVLSNHDVVRHASRLGLPVGERRRTASARDDPQPDGALGPAAGPRGDDADAGAARWRLPLPGRGARPARHTDLPDEVRQDPTFRAHRRQGDGRDGCRVPMPWDADAPSFGFGPAATPGCPSRTSRASTPSTSRRASRARPSSSTARCWPLRRERGLGTGGLRCRRRASATTSSRS